MALRGVLVCLQGELADACTRVEHNLSAWQTQANVDENILHAAAHHRTRIQTLLQVDGYKVKASSVLSRIGKGMFGTIQIWPILQGHLFIPNCTMGVRRVRDRPRPKLQDALATVVAYTSLTLKCNSGL